MDPIATETKETPVVDSKVTEKVVEDVEDTPVVASGEDNETVPAEDAAPTTTEKEEVAAVESSGDAEVTENGNGEAKAAEPVEETEESVKRKVVEVEDDTEVPEKRAKTDEVEAVKPTEEEATA
ncbi:CLUMA_CG011215, isoform A [Clunio marinus]|uniref:CLUMA_CG011215, isoform A n=1 Tax=Clunio marinus TaxID=568069 RepID=A0A1J1IC29_9DIPT|nr:CLUMA_CG011215, isoform A [Clunio marinus]